MPFTPFHFGPALSLGIPLRKYIHAPTFILANVLVDVEPFLVILLGLRYPLHGYLHTFLAAFLAGLAFGGFMFFLEGVFRPLYKFFLLEPSESLNLRSFVVAGASGTMLHVLFDSPLYAEIRPFYPAVQNPLYNPALFFEIYSLCVWIGIFGIMYYVGLVGWVAYRKPSTSSGS